MPLDPSDLNSSSCIPSSGTSTETRRELSGVDLEEYEAEETEDGVEELDVREGGEQASEESVLDPV